MRKAVDIGMGYLTMIAIAVFVALIFILGMVTVLAALRLAGIMI